MSETILVGIDESETARTALSHAVDLAAVTDATVHVITVVEPRGSSYTFGVREIEELNEAAQRVVDEAVDAHEGRDVDLRVDVRRGSPAEAILDYAEEADADRIVVGQRGTSGLSGAIIGSTADRLSRLATVPVTIVPGSSEE